MLSNFIPTNYADIDEDKNSRTLTSKTFSKNWWKKTVISSWHIHYNNKLLLWDGKPGLREVDYTLVPKVWWGWTFTYASFHPTLPQFADGWIEFRDLMWGKDQIIRYKPVCNHVEGQLFQSMPWITYGNWVLYTDAFWAWRDLILYFTRSSLQKIVRIREWFKVNQEERFKFQLWLWSVMPIYRWDDEWHIAYQLNITSPKVVDTGKQTMIWNSEFTYIRPFKCWDDSNNTQTISVEYTREWDSSFLTKIIPASFIEWSQWDVYTDTVTSVFSWAWDWFVSYDTWSASWNEAHDATTWTIADNSLSVCDTESSAFSGTAQNVIKRSFFPFDTSSIPDTDTINSADFKLYWVTIINTDNDWDDFIVTVQTSQASTSTLTTADYDQCWDAIDNPTEWSNRIDLWSLSTSAYNTFTINSTWLWWIDKTWITKLGTRTWHDVIDSPIAANTRDFFRVSTSENAWTSQDPILEVTHSAAAADDNAVMFGMNF